MVLEGTVYITNREMWSPHNLIIWMCVLLQ